MISHNVSYAEEIDRLSSEIISLEVENCDSDHIEILHGHRKTLRNHISLHLDLSTSSGTSSSTSHILTTKSSPFYTSEMSSSLPMETAIKISSRFYSTTKPRPTSRSSTLSTPSLPSNTSWSTSFRETSTTTISSSISTPFYTSDISSSPPMETAIKISSRFYSTTSLSSTSTKSSFPITGILSTSLPKETAMRISSRFYSTTRAPTTPINTGYNSSFNKYHTTNLMSPKILPISPHLVQLFQP